MNTAMRTTGQVATWRADRGFGFIKRDDGLPNIFVHQRNIVVEDGRFRSLLEGEVVEFEVAPCSDDGSDSRVEAVRVNGPGGAPVLGQPDASSAGAPLYHAVQTVSPGAVQPVAPTQGMAARFVPRSVSRAATTTTHVVRRVDDQSLIAVSRDHRPEQSAAAARAPAPASKQAVGARSGSKDSRKRKRDRVAD